MTIRKKLVLAFLVFAAVPMIALGLISFVNARGSLREARIAGLESTADLKASAVEGFLNGLVRDLKISQNYFSIRTNLPIISRHLESTVDPEYMTAKAILDGQLTTFRESLYLIDLVLFDPSGRIVYANKEGRQDRVGSRIVDPVFQEGRSGIYLGSVFSYETTPRQFAMWISAPVLDFSGEFAGVIAFEVDMDPIYEFIGETVGLGKTGETLIATTIEGPDGAMAALFLNPLRHDSDSALIRMAGFGERSAVPIQEALSGRSGSGESVDYRGKNVIAAWRPIPAAGWGLVAKIDTSEAFAPISRLRDLSIVIGGSVMLISVLMTAALSGTIVRPLRELEESARIIGAGNLDHRVGSHSRDEIGELAMTFDQMTADLQRITASRDELDEEVNLRTHLEEDARALLDANPDMILRLNRAGEYLSVKQSRAFKIFGSPEQMIGRHLKDNLPEDLSRLIMDAIARALDTGQDETIEYLIDIDGDHRSREGRIICIGDDEVLLIVRDVTERAQADHALRESEETNRAFARAIPDNQFRISRDGTVLDYSAPNPQFLVDMTGEYVGKTIYDIAPSHVAPPVMKLVEKALETGETQYIEYEFTLRGEQRCSDLRIVASGQDEAIIISRDVTERLQIEQEIKSLNNTLEIRVNDRTRELQYAMDELESFSYSVSHDLRGPLRSINGFTQVVMQKYGDKLDDEGRSYLERVRNATNQMGELIDDILSLSRIGQAELMQEPLDLGKMVLEKEAELKSADPDRQVEFIIADDASAFGDERMIGILVDNLVRNAWKFSSKHATARIELGKEQRNGETVHFIKDDGAGFDMQYADKLFLPFQRLHPAGEFDGTGIGLATVRRIVHRHGGRIWAEGEVEKGATIYFTLGDGAN